MQWCILSGQCNLPFLDFEGVHVKEDMMKEDQSYSRWLLWTAGLALTGAVWQQTSDTTDNTAGAEE